MTVRTIEMSRGQQQQVIAAAFSKHELSISDKVLISQLDPELSATRAVVSRRVEGHRGDAVYKEIDKLFDVAVERLFTPLPNKNVTVERTHSDSEALLNLVYAVGDHQDRMDDASRQMVTDQLLIIFSHICSTRPDVSGVSPFPWRMAVDSALWADNGGFYHRMNILGKAPGGDVRERVSDHVLQGGNIIDMLTRENVGIEPDEKTLLSPDFFALVERLPNDQAIVRSLVLWIGMREHSAIWREIRKNQEKSTSELLQQGEALVESKWDALSPHDKATFLTPWLLLDLRELYPEKLEDVSNPDKDVRKLFTARGAYTLVTTPRLTQLIPRMIQAASRETVAAVSKDIVLRALRNKRLKLGVIADWFPEIARKVEYVRTVPLGKRLMNGLHL